LAAAHDEQLHHGHADRVQRVQRRRRPGRNATNAPILGWTTVALKTRAFPAAYPNPLVADAKLQVALDKAIAAGPGSGWRVGIAIASLEQAGAHPVAHFQGDREYFGASMIKVAALYGLCELRTTLRAIAKELGTHTSKAELLRDAEKHLNPQILANLKNLPALKGVSNNVALPQYRAAFKVDDAAGGTFTVNFANPFAPETGAPTHDPVGYLEDMIVVSNNTSAARCVHACGYGYLNGALASGGLLAPGPKNLGIWLAGDYLDSNAIPKYPYFRIDSDNDNAVAQASTALHMARLLALLDDGVLFGTDAEAKAVMLRVLAKTAAYPKVYLNRASDMGDFAVTHNKLGIAPLKPKNGGHNVESECSIIRHNPTGRRFVVVWLNYHFEATNSFDSIGHVVRDAIKDYLKR
jgi:hypothetical protein